MTLNRLNTHQLATLSARVEARYLTRGHRSPLTLKLWRRVIRERLARATSTLQALTYVQLSAERAALPSPQEIIEGASHV